MNREQAVTYLKFSGFSEEQIKAIEGAFTCDKCVYSTSEGCQYDDITETIPPFEPSESEWQQDHEILKAYSDGASAVLDKIRAEIEHMIPCNKEALSIKLGVLEIIDKYMAEEGEE